MPQKRILIVDADAASRNFIARKLLDENHEIIQADSGKEGLICSWRDRPDLIIVDPTVADLSGEEFAAKLRNDPRTAQIPLVALSSDPHMARSQACLEAGFNEYIVKSGQALPQLHNAIIRLLALSHEGMKRDGLSVIFLSAKGGVGTSSVCANIAMNMVQSQQDLRLAVVDLVLPIGSIASIVGYEGDLNLVSIADLPADKTTPKFFQEQLPNMGIWRFNLLAGSPNPELSNQMNVNRIGDLIMSLKASHDLVLIDIGRTLSKITLPLIQHADLICMLISTDISALPLSKVLLDFLKNKGIASGSIYTILNRSVGLEGLSKANAETGLGITINTTIPYLGTNFAFANSHHQPITLKFPNDTASIIFKDAAGEMMAQARRVRG